MTPFVPRAHDVRPPEFEPSQDPRRLIWVLVKRRWQILAVMMLVVVPALVGTLLQRPLYSASTLIEVNPEGVQVLPYKDIATPETTPNYEVYITTQEQVLRSPSLLGRVQERLRTDPAYASAREEIPRIGAGLSIRRPLSSGVFHISYLGLRPESAAHVANLLAEEFIKRHFQSRQETRERARALLSRELASLEQRVQVSERALVEYAQGHNLQTDERQTDLVQDKLTMLSRQVAEAETELIAAKVRQDSMQTASVTEFPERLMTPVIADRATTLMKLEHDLTGLRASFGEQWPAVVQKRNELNLVREQLEREKATVLAQAREQARLDYRSAESKRQMLTASSTHQEDLVRRLQDASIQYKIIQRDAETNQKLYEGLLERLSQSGVTPGMELGNIHVIEPASPISDVASPRLLWNLLLAAGLGLALGVCVAFARDFWDNSLSTVEELEHVTILPVLATVPRMHAMSAAVRADSRQSMSRALVARALSLRKPETSEGPLQVTAEGAEAIRTLCASILLSRSERPPRVLVVTSASSGEGKSTVARQLGLAFAESGAPTLLVECDLRRPTFAHFFGIDDEGGLSLYLSGHVRNVKIWRTGNPQLHVTAAGPSVPNPVALLNSEKMRSFIREQTHSYQFIILDAPPALQMADAKVLGAIAEGVVLIVRAGRTSKEQLRRVCQTLEGSGANILGAVLNDTEPVGDEYSYYGYRRAPGTRSA